MNCCCPARSCWRRRELHLARGSTAAYGVGLDEVARRFHRYLRSRDQHPSAPRPVTINVWEAVYFDHDLDRLVDLAERAAALGVERYVLDDGWFGSRRNDDSGLGDWTVSPDVWPDGPAPAGRQGPRAGDGVRALVRAGDDQPRLRRRPGAPGVGDGHRGPAAGGVAVPAGDQPGHPGVLRLHPGRDLRDPGRVHDRLHQVGPQPRPDRRRHPAGRTARGARADRWRSTGCSTRSRPPTRGWRSSPAPPAAPGSTSACWSGPTGSGSRTASTRWSGSRCIAGPPS